MANKNVRSSFASGAQQGVQIGNCILRCSRLRDGVAAAWLLTNRGSRPMTSTHPRKISNPSETVNLDLSEMSQSSAEALRPPTKTAVGDPLPLHFRYILRPPPMSTNPAKLPVSAPTATASESTSEAMTTNKMFKRNNRFIDLLGGLQSFRHYVTGLLVPNTRGKYCPTLA